MARLALNKSTLNKEGRKVRAYQKFVPALDLKRKQLLAARATAEQTLQQQQRELVEIEQQVRNQLSMLPNFQGRADQLVSIGAMELSEVNLVGIRLPELKSLQVVLEPFSCLGTEHWLDHLASLLQQQATLRVRQQLTEQRLLCLNQGLQKTTQRLNLFDKVLIPQARQNIRKIQIALADAERAGVVRAKIAKRKRQEMGV
ncbi:V-type ATP synthase subunit D [Nitrincola lacisaponensis]|uniref:V-type ATP synthase subunit D n=1 Tax=Nitrincola lacisaponensis TaxID=267850 RepID=A0A063Y6B2_9GAMM|nr:V-type ATP synthase subunit D [Nitrincola lacisaponensis]KDE40311.1 V-type ATP synthase subunit D [Nitrincola lacisaponensis]